MAKEQVSYRVRLKNTTCDLYENLSKKSKVVATIKNTKDYICSVTDDTNGMWFYLANPAGWIYGGDVTIVAKGSTQELMNLKPENQNKQTTTNQPATKTNQYTNNTVKNINDGSTSSTKGGGGVSMDTGQYTGDMDTSVTGTGVNDISTLDQSQFTYEADLDKYDIGGDLESQLDFKTIKGIFGMPYQYSTSVDRRLSGKNDEMEYGRKFSEKIVMNAPLLFMTPGRPAFMAGYSDEYKRKIAQKLYGMGLNDDEALSDVSDGRYYTFEFAYDDYYTYVNQMVQKASVMAGIGDEKFDGVPLKRYNWANYKNDNLKTFISGSEYVCFYTEFEPQVNESFGNTTGDSSIASTINQLSDLGKEAAFLMGAGAGIDLDAAIKSGLNENLESFTNFFNKWGGSGVASVANKLFKGVSTLALGGHIAFPEIWKDSDFTQSYNITVKFASPDGDPYSQFLNVLVPYYHLLGFMLPQALGVNDYTSPFLVRASMGGAFNCEMGMITSLDVTKGPTWNQYNLPMEMTVSFTIKDMYKTMYMTNTDNVSKFLKHSQFVDFLSNSVGVNVNMPEIGRTLNYYKNFSIDSKINNAVNNIGNSMNNFLSNQVSKLKILW